MCGGFYVLLRAVALGLLPDAHRGLVLHKFVELQAESVNKPARLQTARACKRRAPAVPKLQPLENAPVLKNHVQSQVCRP
jgi:hypothetical protein